MPLPIGAVNTDPCGIKQGPPRAKPAQPEVPQPARCGNPGCNYRFLDKPPVLKDNRHAYGFCDVCHDRLR